MGRDQIFYLILLPCGTVINEGPYGVNGKQKCTKCGASYLIQIYLYLYRFKLSVINPVQSSLTECECIFIKLRCTWFLNRVNPILLECGCPFANDLARLLTNSISTFGGMGGSNGSTYASIIVGFFSFRA